MTCQAEGCERDVRYKAARLCQMHYFRMRRTGRTEKRKRARKTVITPNGYVRVHAPSHPLADPQGYVFEHRKVAYDERGGQISHCERCEMVPVTWDTCHVDHDDCDRLNNDPPNLLVCCVGCNVMRHPHQRRDPKYTMLTFEGVTATASEWSRDLRVTVSSRTIVQRKRAGATDEDALFMEKRSHRSIIAKPTPAKFVNGRRERV